jgi:hypothetical protein
VHGRIWLALAALSTVAGCGATGNARPAPVDPLPFAQLIAHVPAGQRSAITLDVAGARRELGLRPDAAPPVPPDHGSDGARRLRGLVAATVLNYPIRDDGPLDRAIDYRRVTALARADGPPEVLLVATREPWSELRASLGRHGWHDRGDGLLERPPGGRALRWVAGRDGFAVASGDPRAAAAALARRAPAGHGVLPLLQAAGGPARGARIAPGAPCITGVAVGYSPGEAAGRFVLSVRDVPPRPYRLRPARGRRLPAGYAASAPFAAGGRVVVPFSFEATTDPSIQPAAQALTAGPRFTYACSRRSAATARSGREP